MSSLFERAVRERGSGPRRSGGRSGNRAEPYSKDSSWTHDKHDASRDELFPKPAGGSLAERLRSDRDGTSNSGVSPKLLIENLHYDVSERELEVRPGVNRASSDRSRSSRK